MHRLGRAAIAKLKKSDNQWQLVINMGSDQNIKPEDQLYVYTPEGLKIGEATATTVCSNKTLVVADGSLPIKPIHEIHRI